MDIIHVIRDDGQRTVIYVHQTRINTGSLDGPSNMPGLKAYRLADNHPVNVVGDGFVDLYGRTYSPIKEMANG